MVGKEVFGEAALSSAVTRGGRSGGGAAMQTSLCFFGPLTFLRAIT